MHAALIVAVLSLGIATGTLNPTYVHAATLMSLIDFESSNSVEGFLARGKECQYDCSAVNHRDVFSESFTFVTDRVRAGVRSARLAIDSRLDYAESDGKPRVDMAIRPNTMALRDGDEWWLGFSVYYPQDHVFANPSRPEWGPQLHEIQNTPATESFKCGAGGGPIHLNENDGYFAFTTRWSGTLADCEAERYTKNQYDRIAPIRRGAWNDIVLHYRLCADTSSGCTPRQEVWVNGAKVVDAHHLAGDVATAETVEYKYDVAYYAHHELKGDYTRPRGVYYVIVDEIRIAKGSDGFATVDPRRGTTPPPHPQHLHQPHTPALPVSPPGTERHTTPSRVLESTWYKHPALTPRVQPSLQETVTPSRTYTTVATTTQVLPGHHTPSPVQVVHS